MSNPPQQGGNPLSVFSNNFQNQNYDMNILKDKPRNTLMDNLSGFGDSFIAQKNREEVFSNNVQQLKQDLQYLSQISTPPLPNKTQFTHFLDARLVTQIKLYQARGLRLTPEQQAQVENPQQTEANIPQPMFIREIPFMVPLLKSYDEIITNLNSAVQEQVKHFMEIQMKQDILLSENEQMRTELEKKSQYRLF